MEAFRPAESAIPPMIRFLHSADWQLGARFTQFGGHGARLREARMETLRRMASEAVRLEVDFMCIAGDLFEDNQVADRLVADAFAILASSRVPTYILPGNHDPISGPDCVWNRPVARHPPAGIHILRNVGVTEVGHDALLIVSPLSQKHSTSDPSLPLVAASASAPAGRIRIGITHGSPAIASLHQENDFPIALDAASRADLDFLAIGHWHNWLEGLDGGRILMPGTPEPDRFSNDSAGRVALVEIAEVGALPRISPVAVATLDWKLLELDLFDPAAAAATLTARLEFLLPRAGNTVLRIRMSGAVDPAGHGLVSSALEPLINRFPIHQVVDETRLAPGPADWANLRSGHPLLAEVLSDIDRLEVLATGVAPRGEAPPGEGGTGSDLTPATVRELLTASQTDIAALRPEHLAAMRHLLFEHLPEDAR
jgi:hypothetical protein